MSQQEHFDAIAERYDALRVPPGLTILHDTLVREGGLVGKRVLDIGCGTGAALELLAREFGCMVAGIDASTGMIGEARLKLPDADLRQGVAEELPFADESFDAVLTMLAVHHLDRTRAFAEAHRVLAPAGRFVIATPHPDGFPRAWMASVFPSYVAVEQARFPHPDTLASELQAAGFSGVRLVPLSVPRRFSKASAMERLRGRVYSTLDHLSPDEVSAGIERAERDLPDPVEYTLEWAIVVAAR